MISIFICERRKYSFENLQEMVAGAHANLRDVLRQLKTKGIVKIVKKDADESNLNDLTNEGSETDEITGNGVYVFTYIGIIAVKDIILKCYPKYIKSEPKPLKQLKQVLKVIERYDSQTQKLNLYGDVGDKTTFNKLPLMLFLLKDYYDNGLYSSNKNTVDINGRGEILWNKTINSTFAYIDQDEPYYPVMYTRRHITDERDYFRRLHACLLSMISNELENTGLAELLDIAGVLLADENLEDLGNIADIIYKLDREIDVQFNTRKKLLLRAMASYIMNSEAIADDNNSVSLFGTTSFDMVWEDVCGEVLGNERNSPLRTLDLPEPLHEEYDTEANLLSVIAYPAWHGLKPDGSHFVKMAGSTLIPDFLKIGFINGKSVFVILDAKYYNLQFSENKKLSGQPGIESVTKQYLYDLAYREFMWEHNIETVSNCFLFPTEELEIVERGYVNLKFLSMLGLANIAVRLIPATKLYDYYLSSRKMSIGELNLPTESTKGQLYTIWMENKKA